MLKTSATTTRKTKAFRIEPTQVCGESMYDIIWQANGEEDAIAILVTKKDLLDLKKSIDELFNKPKVLDKLVSSQIKEIMTLFYHMNPSLNFANKTYRDSAEWMIDQAEKNGSGFEYIKKLTKAVIKIQGKEFAPSVSNPYEMKTKLFKIKQYFERNNKNKTKVYEG